MSGQGTPSPVNTQAVQADQARNTLLGLIYQTLKSLAISPYTTATNVAGLPAAASTPKGTRGFVTDATATTFASVVAGGGANNVPVYCDNAAWRIG